MQVCTGTLVVTTEGAQVIVIQLLLLLPVCGVQVATGVLLVLLLPQLMVCQLFPALPTCEVHVLTGTLVVLALPHVVVT